MRERDSRDGSQGAVQYTVGCIIDLPGQTGLRSRGSDRHQHGLRTKARAGWHCTGLWPQAANFWSHRPVGIGGGCVDIATPQGRGGHAGRQPRRSTVVAVILCARLRCRGASQSARYSCGSCAHSCSVPADLACPQQCAQSYRGAFSVLVVRCSLRLCQGSQ